MNSFATKLHLKNTKYANSHGALAAKYNTSTAFEQALLSSHIMKVPLIRAIVGTKSRTTTTYVPLDTVLRQYYKI
jgi:D-alanyl-D-alanine carboxypeptidase